MSTLGTGYVSETMQTFPKRQIASELDTGFQANNPHIKKEMDFHPPPLFFPERKLKLLVIWALVT